MLMLLPTGSEGPAAPSRSTDPFCALMRPDCPPTSTPPYLMHPPDLPSAASKHPFLDLLRPCNLSLVDDAEAGALRAVSARAEAEARQMLHGHAMAPAAGTTAVSPSAEAESRALHGRAVAAEFIDPATGLPRWYFGTAEYLGDTARPFRCVGGQV